VKYWEKVEKVLQDHVRSVTNSYPRDIASLCRIVDLEWTHTERRESD